MLTIIIKYEESHDAEIWQFMWPVNEARTQRKWACTIKFLFLSLGERITENLSPFVLPDKLLQNRKGRLQCINIGQSLCESFWNLDPGRMASKCWGWEGVTHTTYLSSLVYPVLNFNSVDSRQVHLGGENALVILIFYHMPHPSHWVPKIMLVRPEK